MQELHGHQVLLWIIEKGRSAVCIWICQSGFFDMVLAGCSRQWQHTEVPINITHYLGKECLPCELHGSRGRVASKDLNSNIGVIWKNWNTESKSLTKRGPACWGFRTSTGEVGLNHYRALPKGSLQGGHDFPFLFAEALEYFPMTSQQFHQIIPSRVVEWSLTTESLPVQKR